MVRKAEARDRGARFLLVAAALVIVVAGLRAIKPIALPLLIATFLSVLSSPLMAWLLRHRVPQGVSVLLAVLCNVAVVAALLFLVGGSLSAFSESIPVYRKHLETRASAALDWLEQRGIDTAELSWLEGRDPAPEPAGEVDAPGDTEPAPRTPESFINIRALVDLVIGGLVNLVSGTLRGIASLATTTMLIFFLMAFILFEAVGLPRKLELVLGWQDDELSRMSRAKQEIQRYLGYKTLISLLTGIVVAFWTWLLGVNFPLLWGLIAFLLNYIPTIGSIIAALPAVTLTLLEMGPGKALVVALGYIVVNLVLGNFVEPHLMGRRFGISTLVVFLSLLFWGWVWGPIGMLLSVPITMALKIALEHTEDFRWVGQLIGARPVPAGGGRAGR